MSKPLAGRRLFDARGRSAASRGLPISYQRIQRRQLPMWAQAAWACGWLDQYCKHGRVMGDAPLEPKVRHGRAA